MASGSYTRGNLSSLVPSSYLSKSITFISTPCSAKSDWSIFVPLKPLINTSKSSFSAICLRISFIFHLMSRIDVDEEEEDEEEAEVSVSGS